MRTLFGPTIILMFSGLAMAQSRGPALDPAMRLQYDLEKALADIRDNPPESCEDKDGRSAWSAGLERAIKHDVAIDSKQTPSGASNTSPLSACDEFQKSAPKLNCCKSAYIVASELFARLIKDAEARCASGDDTLAYRLNTSAYVDFREGLEYSRSACTVYAGADPADYFSKIAFDLCEVDSDWFGPLVPVDPTRMQIDPSRHRAITQCGGKINTAKRKGIVNPIAFHAGWYGPVRACVYKYYTSAKGPSQGVLDSGLQKSPEPTPVGSDSTRKPIPAAGDAR